MAGLFSRLKIWNQDDDLTYSDLNAEFNNILANVDASHSEGYSQNLSQMQTTEDPGAVGSENLSQPISTADEIERIRFVINRIIGGSQWYSAPPVNLTELQSAVNTSNNLPNNYVASGTIDSFGQPDFIRANTTNVEVLASNSNPLNVVINGTSYSFTANITVSGLASAPSSQNTTTLNTTLSSDLASTAFGEKIFDYFYYGTVLPINPSGASILPVTSTGTAITAKIGKLVAMKIAGVSSVNDYILCRVFSSTALNGTYRGFFKDTSGAGTPRCKLAGTETITLLELTYLFLSSGGGVTAVYNEPTYSVSTPSAPSTGDMWYDMGNRTWKIFNGTAFVVSNSLLIGICAQDSSGNCIISRSGDIYGNYAESNEVTVDPNSVKTSTSVIQSRGLGGNVSVYGNKYTKLNNWSWDLTVNMDTGQTAASGFWFLYISQLGKTFISSIAPNDRSADLYGYYHPNKPWRCVAMVNATSSTVWDANNYNIINLGEFTNDRIPDQSLSIYKMKARLASGGANTTVGGFGIGPSMSGQVTGNTYVQYSTFSVAINATGIRPVMIGVTSDASGNTCEMQIISSAAANAQVQLRNGSTVIGTVSLFIQATGSTLVASETFPVMIDFAPLAGLNTYTIWMKTSASSAVAVEFNSGARLYAYELI